MGVINSHIRVDDKGVAWIEGTRIKVIEVVMDKLAWGWSPEEIHDNHPRLSLAQIHGAFTYYYDHKTEIERQMQEREELARKLRAETENKALQARFRDLKRKQ